MAKSKFIAIKSNELVIDLFDENDINDEYVSWLNDPEVVKFSNQRFKQHSIDSCLNYAKTFENTQNLFVKISTINDLKMVGTMTVYINEYHKTADIGIMVGDKSQWGKGVGKQAWQMMIDWLKSLKTYRKITAGTMNCNIGMLKVMESCGMTLEATKVKQELLDGKEIDLKYYGLFTEE